MGFLVSHGCGNLGILGLMWIESVEKRSGDFPKYAVGSQQLRACIDTKKMSKGN